MILYVEIQSFKCPMWDVLKSKLPLTCGKTSQIRELIILCDVEEKTCSDTILKMKHPTQNQLAMGGEAQDLICGDVRFQMPNVRLFDSPHKQISQKEEEEAKPIYIAYVCVPWYSFTLHMKSVLIALKEHIGEVLINQACKLRLSVSFISHHNWLESAVAQSFTALLLNTMADYN